MSRWVVSHIPAWLLLIGLVVLIAGGAVLVQRYVRRRFPGLNGEEHNDVTRFTYGFIGFVYAFFVGFVVSAMWHQMDTADIEARAEGAAAYQMASDAVVFDTGDRDRVRHNLLGYEKAAIPEWSGDPMLRTTAADTALADLYSGYGQVRPHTDAQKTLLATSYSNLNKISQARTERLWTSRTDDGPTLPEWALIFVTSTFVLGSVITYGVSRPAQHDAMVAIVGVIIATNLFVVLELSHPYVGESAISSDNLQEVVSMLSQPVS